MTAQRRDPKTGLTQSQMEFVTAWLASDRTDASAIYKAKHPAANANTCRKQAHKILADTNVQAYIERISAKVEQKLVKKLVIDKQWVMDQFVEVVAMAKAAVPVLDKAGNPIGVYQQNLPAANTALTFIGKELGMGVERRETGKPGSFSAKNMTDQELLEDIQRRGAKLGLRLVLPVKKSA